MAAASDINLISYRGDSPVFAFQLTNTANPLGIDITGFVFEMTVDTREDPDDNSTELFTVAAVITDALTGRFTFQPTTANMTQAPSDYFYDVSLVNGSEKVTIIKSKFEIRQDIGKA